MFEVRFEAQPNEWNNIFLGPFIPLTAVKSTFHSKTEALLAHQLSELKF